MVKKWVQKHKSTGYEVNARDLAEQDAATQAKAHKPQERTEETDKLLDEIDLVLEHKDEEFVASYAQKGGE